MIFREFTITQQSSFVVIYFPDVLLLIDWLGKIKQGKVSHIAYRVIT